MALNFSDRATKIVSLVPSQTELLFDLGLDDEVVGITKFCVHPPDWRTTKKIVGGTKSVKIERVRELKPDLIIANKEENTKEDIELLSRDFPVYVSDVADLDDCCEMIERIGGLVGKQDNADSIVRGIKEAFASFKTSINRKVAYLIWREPYMVAGNDTFIHAMLEATGFVNVIDQPRYPEVSLDDLKSFNPDFVFLSSEPYPFKKAHLEELRKAGLDGMLVDGELFSWHGSRIEKLPQYVSEMIW